MGGKCQKFGLTILPCFTTWTPFSQQQGERLLHLHSKTAYDLCVATCQEGRFLQYLLVGLIGPHLVQQAAHTVTSRQVNSNNPIASANLYIPHNSHTLLRMHVLPGPESSLDSLNSYTRFPTPNSEDSRLQKVVKRLILPACAVVGTSGGATRGVSARSGAAQLQPARAHQLCPPPAPRPRRCYGPHFCPHLWPGCNTFFTTILLV